MKKDFIKIIILVLVLSISTLCQYSFRYNGLGFGGHSGLAVNDYGATVTLGGHGFVELTFGRAGRLQIIPSIGFWNKSEKSNYTDALNTLHEYRYKYRQVALNLTDIKYIIPIPKDIFILPYAGLGLLSIVVNVTRTKETETTIGGEITIHPEDRRSGSNLCLNFFAGLDFPVSDIVVPFAEIRFSATPWQVFRVLGGVSFCF